MNGSVETGDDRVRVRKSVVEAGPGATVSLEFAIVSTAEDAVSVHLVDDLPGSASSGDVGPTPAHEDDRWTVSEGRGRLTFDGHLDPGEEVTVRWDVRVPEGADRRLLREPRVETGAAAGGGAAGEPSLRELFEGRADDAPATGQGERRGDPVTPDGGSNEPPRGPGSESTAGGDDTDDVDATAPVEGVDRGTDPGQGGADPGREGDLVSALVRELRDGRADGDELAALRDALGVERPESHRIQMRHLQSEIAEARAYADEFEAFVDREGRPAELVSEFRAALDGASARLDRLEGGFEEAARERDEAVDRLDAVERAVDRLDDRGDELKRLRYKQAALEEEIERVEGWRDRVDALESEHGEALASLRSEVRAVAEDVGELVRWRERMADAFGSMFDESRD